ncbi:MAG: acetyl-CoA carboxylase, biotin carboxyl carrier protein [Holosporales bacterium]|jgi:acetyl-CoA carboxylase biotin carboxyl carrier protein|nr:acetyl-CoA carboxylase, biotin carboxyl carrier protein [Holosporales bacterium]
MMLLLRRVFGRSGTNKVEVDEGVFDKLADVLKRHDLGKIEYRNGEVVIKMTRSSLEGYTHRNGRPRDTVTNMQDTEGSIIADAVTQQSNASVHDFSGHPGALKSPIVGTCYLTPEPGAANFVAVGDNVQEGQPMFIIEAMKVMNLIKAQKAGKVIHIALSNASPVEYGQLLAVIE